MAIGKILSKGDSGELSHATQYRIIIEALQYCTLIRPEINYSINKLCQFLH